MAVGSDAGAVRALGFDRPRRPAVASSLQPPWARRLVVASLLTVADLAAVEAAIWLAAIAMQATGLSPLGYAPDYAVAFATAAPVLLVIGACFGLYDGRGPSPFERFRLRACCSLLFFSGAVVAAALAPERALQLLVFAPAAALLTVLLGCSLEAGARGVLTRRSFWGAPAVVLGCGVHSRALAAKLLAQPELGIRPVGFLDDGDPTGVTVGGPLPVLGSLADADQVAHLAEIAVVPQPAALRLAAIGGMDALPFAHLVITPEVPGAQALGLRARNLGDTVGLELRRETLRPLSTRTKRALDLVVAVPLLALALPLIAVLAGAVKLISPGEAFYKQRRVGRNGEPVLVPKLRSMYHDADRRLQEHLANDEAARAEWDRYMKLSRDPRVLPVIGSFIRRASLDELPQLWNVVRGDMSLVGPRPFPLYHVSRFDPDFQALRVSVPPGLTGFWQVSSRSDGDLDVQKEQDSFYIRNWSIWLDLYIILRTIPAILNAKGAR